AHWNATLNLTPGSNSIAVVAFDSFGGASRVITRSVFFQTPAQLTLVTNGLGRIVTSARIDPAPSAGRWMTFTAVPAPDNLFASWAIESNGVDISSAANPLRILLPINLTLQANFASNYFQSVAGTYAGLFFNPADVSPQTAGMIRSLVVGPRGGFTGRIF